MDKFEYVNCTEHEEYYKWQVCHEFPILMKKALEASNDEFGSAFYDVKKCTVYDLFDGISFTKKNMKEKQLYLAEKVKAESLKKDFDKAKKDMDALQKALEFLADAISVGDEVSHTKYGKGMVKTINDKYLVAEFPEKEAKLSLAAGIANNIIPWTNPVSGKKPGNIEMC